jgi:hypothetical protein
MIAQGEFEMALLVALLCFSIGSIALFNKSLAWKMQRWSNDQRGVVSQKPENWETGVNIGGCLWIIFGLVILLIAS